MKHSKSFHGLFLVCILIGAGCSGGRGPVDLQPGVASVQGSGASTHLWGYYDVYVDVENQTAQAVANRSGMFTANVVNFLNSKPAGLSFHINGTPVTPDYVDVDIDVSITHPFPGLHQYDGYDVRGVFMGDGSASLNYNPELIYPVLGTDQFMLADPVDGFGGPDGYTRWFNRAEFSAGGMPLFQYTPGKLASQGFAGTSTLNAYKYFTDGLQPNEEAFTWLDENADQHGIFNAGATSTRNYYLRFPNTTGVEFGYAVIANWGGVDPEDHPSNAPEAVGCKVVDTSDVWWEDPSQNGGDLVLDVSLFNWKLQPAKIFVESTVLSAVHELTPSEMTPVGGNENYSTYHVEVPADQISGQEGQEYWIIAECGGEDYTNDFGVDNLAGTDPLAAFFRNDLYVGGAPNQFIEVTSPNGGEVWNVDSTQEITWLSSDDFPDVKIEYSKDGFVADIHEIVSITPNDMSYDWQVPNDPSTTVRVRISDANNPFLFDVSDNDFTIGTGECGTGVHDTLQYEGTYQLNWNQAPVPDWHHTYDIASLPDGRVLMQGFSGGVPCLEAFDVTQDGLADGEVLISGQWGTSEPNWIMSMDVCDVTGNIAFVLASNYGKLLVFDSTGKHVASIASTHDVYTALDTDWEGGIWTIEYILNSDPTPLGIQAFIEHYEWTGTTYVHVPADSIEITKDLELNPCKVTEIGIVHTAKRLILLEHSSYPWKGNMYNYDLSGGQPALMPELTQLNFLSSPLSESQIGHWRKAFDIEIDHSDPAFEGCRIMLGRRSGSGWDDGSFFTRYDIDMNMLGEYHVVGTPLNDHLLESFTLCPNPDDPDGIFLTIQEGWLSHADMDRFEVYGMPTDW